MKVKKYYPEYKNWLTENQWAKQSKVIIDKTKAVELWSNQFCSVCSWYAAPDNVRDMTEEEIIKYKNKIKLHRKEIREEAKRKKEAFIRRCRYAEQMREDWHTEWQWLSQYRRIVNNGAVAKDGDELNHQCGKDWCVFGSNYCYYNIKDTRYIEDEEEYKRLIDESNKNYYEQFNK